MIIVAPSTAPQRVHPLKRRSGSANLHMSSPDNTGLLDTLCLSTISTGVYDKPDKAASQASVLDDLASLSVCKARGQIVAVGAVLTGGRLEIHVAENANVGEAIVKNIQSILDLLQRIKALPVAKNVENCPHGTTWRLGQDPAALPLLM
ncbi:hypothetical protein OF83DRAFT_1121767 [Amylostereum chailletii]|nr:hypothetical protein OF83DRAFT_1121767 [Amylostereum chailletii]